MSDATACAGARATSVPCPHCDVLLGLQDTVHVERVERDVDQLVVTVSTPWQLMGCPSCGVVAPSRGRRRRVLHDVPHGTTAVHLIWRQRVWRCPDPGCPRGTFMEQVGALVGPRGSITTRAISWAITSLRTQHATIAGLARQLGVSWWTLWRAIKPELERLAADPKRFVGVSSLGVDEHIWHHGDPRGLSIPVCKGCDGVTGGGRSGRGRRGRVGPVLPSSSWSLIPR